MERGESARGRKHFCNSVQPSGDRAEPLHTHTQRHTIAGTSGCSLLSDKFSGSLGPFRNGGQQPLQGSACSYNDNETYKLIKVYLLSCLARLMSTRASYNLVIVSLNIPVTSSRFTSQELHKPRFSQQLFYKFSHFRQESTVKVTV